MRIEEPEPEVTARPRRQSLVQTLAKFAGLATWEPPEAEAVAPESTTPFAGIVPIDDDEDDETFSEVVRKPKRQAASRRQTMGARATEAAARAGRSARGRGARARGSARRGRGSSDGYDTGQGTSSGRENFAGT